MGCRQCLPAVLKQCEVAQLALVLTDGRMNGPDLNLEYCLSLKNRVYRRIVNTADDGWCKFVQRFSWALVKRVATAARQMLF